MRAAVKKLNRKLGDGLQSGAFLAPSLLGVLAFFFIPFVVVIYYAMIDNPIAGNFVFLRNFQRVWGNLAFQTASRNTALFTAVSVPLAVTLSLGLAFLLEQRIPLKSQLRTFFLSPMMVPVASIVLIWQVLFHQNGAVNELILSVGTATGWFGDAGTVDWFSSSLAPVPIILLFLWRNLGYNMILFMAALANIPHDLVEVAQLEGASSRYIFRSVKMRFLSPTIVFVTILSIINSFKIFREVYLLAGSHPYEALYTLQHYMNNMFDHLDYQSLAAAALIMSLIIIAIIGIIFIAENRYGRDVEG